MQSTTPDNVPPITTVVCHLSNHATKTTVGLPATLRQMPCGLPRQTDHTYFYVDLLNALSDKAARVVAHELPMLGQRHVSRNSPLRGSRGRQRGDGEWGFGPTHALIRKQILSVGYDRPMVDRTVPRLV